MKTGIALIGFMGTGKSAVGEALARSLGKEFIELDQVIERKAGKSISEIFQQDGEIAFRELEIEVAKEVSTRKNAVIACGGGLVLNKINIDRLKQECILVYLTASPAAILRRTVRESQRPLLNSPDRMVRIKELLAFRRPFYERATDIRVNTSRLSIPGVVEQIINRLKQHEGFSI